jgi:hypothetical protein
MMTWRERIQAARERGGFTREDRHDANKWCACAVGEQRRVMPGVIPVEEPKWIGQPVDWSLYDAGNEFDDAVSRNDFALAEHLLDLIEDRALALKRAAGAGGTFNEDPLASCVKGDPTRSFSGRWCANCSGS